MANDLYLEQSHDDLIFTLKTQADELKMIERVQKRMVDDYRHPTMEEAYNEILYQDQCDRYENDSDWGRVRPKTVNFNRLKYYKNHRLCSLVIRSTDNVHQRLGLYCAEHNKLVTWINEYQVYWLMRPSNYKKIRNDSDTTGLYHNVL